MKKYIFTFVFLLASIAARAYDTKIDGIYYKLVPKAKIAEVVTGDEKYAGQVDIPSTVEYEGVVYNVVSIAALAFRECFELTSVTIPEGVTEIKQATF